MGKVIMSGIVPQLVAPEIPGIKASELAVGSSVYLMEDGTAVEYLVVNQGIPSKSTLYDDSCEGLWLLRKELCDSRVWSSEVAIYANSDIHAYLNTTFLNLFDTKTKSAIKNAKIPCRAGITGSSISSSSSGLSARIFLLSGYELGWTTSNASNFPVDGACLDYFKGTAATDTKRIGYYDGNAKGWWMRSSLMDGGGALIFFVGKTGNFSNESCSIDAWIRPALVLSSDAIFDEETLVLKGTTNGTVSVFVSVTDVYGGVSALLGTKGALTVGGSSVSVSGATITVAGSTATVEYKLTGDIGAARTVTVNGTAIGSVHYAGDSVSTTISVSDGDAITVAFT